MKDNFLLQLLWHKGWDFFVQYAEQINSQSDSICKA